jgi:hypothetical protein
VLYDYHWVVDTSAGGILVNQWSKLRHYYIYVILADFGYSVYMYMYVLFAYLLTKSFKSFGYKVIPETRRAL